MERYFFSLGAGSAFVAVAAGAFGAHALRGALAPDLLDVFETAARYQIYHALALLAVGWLTGRCPSGAARLSGWFFVAGTILFSGSLYALSLSGVRWLGAITPLGGLAFLGGWLALAQAGRGLAAAGSDRAAPPDRATIRREA
jgi:uncharacterized membrane protein YgdD (TMEM256/DUF423 family)